MSSNKGVDMYILQCRPMLKSVFIIIYGLEYACDNTSFRVCVSLCVCVVQKEKLKIGHRQC